MRFTSLVIELIAPGRGWWSGIVVLFQAALWLILPVAAVSKPSRRPCDRSRVWPGIPVGTVLGPPLAVLARRYRVSRRGNHMFGVYLLAQLCGSRRSGRSICWRAPLSRTTGRCSRSC